MTLGLSKSLTEMSTRNLPGGEGGELRAMVREVEKITAICEPIVRRMWEPRRFINISAFAACYRYSFTIFLFVFLFAHISRRLVHIETKVNSYVTVMTTVQQDTFLAMFVNTKNAKSAVDVQ
jgi:hypothetical protein